MFDGVPEQFHQFIGARASPSPLPLPPPPAFPCHGFDPVPNSNPSPPPPPTHHLKHHFLHHPSVFAHNKDVQEEEARDRSLIAMSTNFDIDAQAHRSIPGTGDHSPWSNEEVVALLRIRAGMENWLPEVTWEHVSRKLAEIGFKRSAEKCEEKFEEQTRTFNNDNNNIININFNYSKNSNYTLLVNELEGLYDHRESGNHQTPPQQLLREVPHNNVNIDDDDENIEKTMEDDERGSQPGEAGENIKGQNNMEEVDSRAVETAAAADNEKRLSEEEANDDKVTRKRKRREKFEMFKRFCENVVERLIVQQEEMHRKLVEDMMTREKEMVEREEARKKMEMEWVEKELQIRAREQSISHDRQAAIIELLKRFTSPNPCPDSRADMENEPGMTPATGDSVDNDWSNPCPPTTTTTVSPKPNSSSAPQNPRSSHTELTGTGKRWPREEVMALINLRCTIQGNGEDGDHRHPQAAGAMKAPVWERIARGMSELGYRRSAKRCKEKWENINKYFKKTRDSNLNKKRSPDSRTCPYFHQLSALHNRGKHAAAVLPENCPSSPDYQPNLPEVEN